MVLGNPKYKYQDSVEFDIEDVDGKTATMHGTVLIVDAHGTFMIPDEICYDVMVGNVLIKHLRESQLRPYKN